MFNRDRSVAAQVVTVQAVVALFVVGLTVALAYRQAEHHVRAVTTTRVLDLAGDLAVSSEVRAGLDAPSPASALGPFVEAHRTRTGTDFIVVMSPDGTRYTHPNPDLVGHTYVGTIAPARRGATVVEDYTGSLGPSTRAVVPVTDAGRVVGLVAVGLHRDRAEVALQGMIPEIVLPGLGAALLSGLGAWWAATRVRRQTLGLNALELRRLADHHEAVLHAVREGLVITDVRGRLQVANDEGMRLLGLGKDDIGKPVAELPVAASVRELMTSGEQHADTPHASAGRVLLVSSADVRRHGEVVATLTTLRDRTELAELTGRLGEARGLADALQAQAHESANRLQTVVSLIELGRPDDAVAFATRELRDTQRFRDGVLAAIGEPSVAALVIGKAAQASERGANLQLDPDAHLPAGAVGAHEAVTILGNLIDNALDAVGAEGLAERTVTVDAQASGDEVVLTVADTGPGMSPDAAAAAFARGWSTKPTDAPGGRGLGLALVEQTVARLGGTVTVGPPPGATFEVRLPR